MRLGSAVLIPLLLLVVADAVVLGDGGPAVDGACRQEHGIGQGRLAGMSVADGFG